MERPLHKILATLLILTPLALPADGEPPSVDALVGVRIVIAPGEVLEEGNLVLRDGVIEAIGPEVKPPPDARIHDFGEADPVEAPGDVPDEATGSNGEPTDEAAGAGETSAPVTVYPDLIDPYTVLPWPSEEGEGERAQAPVDGHPNDLVHPEREMARHAADADRFAALRRAGFTTAVVAPEEGLFRGWSTLTNLGDGPLREQLLVPRVAQNVTFTSHSFGGDYPMSLMGAVALFRQTLLDAAWYPRAQGSYRSNPAQPRPPYDRSLETLAPIAAGRERVVFETEDLLGTLRIARLVETLGLDAWLVGNGEEYRRLGAVAASGLTTLLPLTFPERPEAGDEDDLSVGLEELRHWDRAPENPRLLLDAGLVVAFTSHGLDEPSQIHARIARSVERGLDPEAALAALTTTPAALLGLTDRAGSLEPGKMANLVVVEGELFSENPKIREVWIDGRRYELEAVEPPEVEAAGTWELVAVVSEGMEFPVTLELEGAAARLDGQVIFRDQPISLASARVSGKEVIVSFSGDSFGMPGTFTFRFEIDGDRARGRGTGPRGSFRLEGRRTATPNAPEVIR